MPHSLHYMMHRINVLHHTAHPEIPSQQEIAYLEQQKQELLVQLKADGKRVFFIEADSIESCGRYYCEGEDGYNAVYPRVGVHQVEV